MVAPTRLFRSPFPPDTDIEIDKRVTGAFADLKVFVSFLEERLPSHAKAFKIVLVCLVAFCYGKHRQDHCRAVGLASLGVVAEFGVGCKIGLECGGNLIVDCRLAFFVLVRSVLLLFLSAILLGFVNIAMDAGEKFLLLISCLLVIAIVITATTASTVEPFAVNTSDGFCRLVILVGVGVIVITCSGGGGTVNKITLLIVW
mmetsp:Transcript_21917/g.62862  ORF Transcript_21917/g.62862 Transcript_21917/m.62862 type:complete len:201 (+) Transcript_21917:4085-4687(+)